MKFLVVLAFLFILNFCQGTLCQVFVDNNINKYNTFSLIYSNPVVHYQSRYINDLGHEFPISFVVDGTYWKGGAWGYKNGYNNYYGNIYYMGPRYHVYYEDSFNIPEPSTLLLLSSASLLLRKNTILK